MGRFTLNLVIGVLVAVFALSALRVGLSRGLASPSLFFNPQLAVQLGPTNSDALQGQALMLLAQGDRAGARAMAQHAIALEPFHASSLRVLGLIDQAGGDVAATRRAMSAAGAMSWRDGPAQAWMLQDSLSTGRLEDALDHADSLLRRAEDVDDSPITPMLAAAAQMLPPIVDPLARRLAGAPPWRTRMLIRLTSTPGFETGARGVLMRLRQGPTPPRDVEFAQLISREVMLHQFAQALADWRAISPRAARQGGNLRDGDFALPPDGTPFTWTFQDNAGASQERGPAPDLPAGVQALTVQYDGISTPDLALQIVVLPPGPHRLIWRERVEEGDAGPLAWEVRCLGSPSSLARAEPAPEGAHTWRSRALDFTVPATGCEAQAVRLTARPGDRRTSIVVLYTSIAL